MRTKKIIQNDISRFKSFITDYTNKIEYFVSVIEKSHRLMNELREKGYTKEASEIYTDTDIMETETLHAIQVRLDVARLLRDRMVAYSLIPEVTNHDIAQLLGVNHIALGRFIKDNPELDRRLDVLAMCNAESLIDTNSPKPLYWAMAIAFEDAYKNLDGLKEYADELKAEQDAGEKQ